jgi:hypothetical protein
LRTIIVIVLVVLLIPLASTTGAFSSRQQGLRVAKSQASTFESIPNIMNASRDALLSDGEVNVYGSYSHEPAPMGIADYGVGPNGGYEYATNTSLGSIFVGSLSTQTSGKNPTMSFQLNVNLQFSVNDKVFVYWIQDVAFLDTNNNTIYFFNNVWNFSQPGTSILSNSTISGNGQVYKEGSLFYYAAGASLSLPGNGISLSLPSTFELEASTMMSQSNHPEVTFSYDDGSGLQTFDTVSFATSGKIALSGFVVDGLSYNPAGLFYDSELIMGGPGDGLQTQDLSSDVKLQLYYRNDYNFEMISNAYNFGSDTAEGISNALSRYSYYQNDGQGIAEIQAGAGTLGILYTSSQIGIVNIHSPITSGVLYVENATFTSPSPAEISFVNGDVVVTLVPGKYDVQLYQGGKVFDQTTFTISGGQYLTLQSPFSGAELTLSYSVADGGTGYSAPVLTYTHNGVQQNVALTTSPTAYPVDAGTTWTVSGTLTGSSGSERWQTDQQTIGTASSQTIQFTYYHQFLVPIGYQLVGGGSPAAPALSYYSFATPTSTILATSSQSVWIDSGSQYSVPTLLSGSSSTLRWATMTSSGLVTGPSPIIVDYYQQFYVTIGYAVSGGGSGYGAPSVTCSQFGSNLSAPVGSSIWADAASTCNYSASLPGSTQSERWAVSSPSIIVSAPGALSPTYYHQYSLETVYAIDGGGSPAPPTLTVVVFGASSTASLSSDSVTGWADAGSPYVLSNPLPSSTSSERWSTAEATGGTLNGPTTLSVTFYHQFLISALFALVGGGTPVAPSLSYLSFGAQTSAALSGSPQSFWADSSAQYSAPAQLNGSSSSERWSSSTDSGTVQSAATLTFTYYHQFLLSITGAGLSSQWFNASATATISVPGVYNRTAGVGLRIGSYSIDGGAPTAVKPTTGLVTISVLMDAAHQLSIGSVEQFQVSLDATTTKALLSITSPTIGGDDYWYDSGTAVTLTLNGVYGRSAGNGTRLTSYTVNGGASTNVETKGAVTVLNAISISSAQNIAATTVTQYPVTFDTAADSALLSCTASTISGDDYWYDSGTTGVSCTLDGVYGRSGGSGTRVASYNWDGGVSASEATIGNFTTSGLMMSAAHQVNVNTVIQYELSTSSGSVASATSTAIPGDAGWYDAGTQVTVSYDYSWNSTFGQSRANAVGYTIGQGAPVSLKRAANGTFPVQITMSAPQTISVQSVTQYPLTISGGFDVTLSQPSPTADSYYDSGSALTVSTDYTWDIIDGNTRQNLLSYSLDGQASNVTRAYSGTFTTPAITFTGPHELVFIPVTQYLISFQFKDNTGTHTITPTSFQIQVDDPQIINSTQPQLWLDSGAKYQIVSVIWEGSNVKPNTQTVYSVTAPVNQTVADSVFTGRIQATDYLGVPISGAMASITLANGTTIQRSTSGNGTVILGLIPLGTFHGSLSYLGTTTPISGDASTQAQTPVKVFASYPTLGLLGVLVAILLVAVVLTIRRRSSKSSPQADQSLGAPSLVCKYCGSSVGSGEVYCPECGRPQA